MSVIEFNNVTFEYCPGEPALNGVSLAVEQGEFVAVLGANGSGKSTLARQINALLVPTSGSVHVFGMDTRDFSAQVAIRQRVGMVFQNPDNQAVTSLVRDDVAFGPENLGVAPAEIKQRVADALEAVGMLEHAGANIAELSGGQKQRVAIAGALALQPDVLVLDEPSALLDPVGRDSIIENCRCLNEQGMTIILITHFMEEALSASRIIVMAEGQIALQGSPEQVFASREAATQLQQLHLELPFAAQLALDLNAAGIPVNLTLSEAELEEQLCSWYSKK